MSQCDVCSNTDPLKVQDFNISSSLCLEYPTLQSSNSICKYSYKNWCATCEKKSTRLRSQSECLEPSKKKCKEMKSPVKRYLENNQYENMELEYDIKDVWFESKHQRNSQVYDCCRLSSSLNETNNEYFDCCGRVRSNLCELPTTYIRNTDNCQTLKMSERDKNFVECLENRVKSYEKTIKYVEYSENVSVLDETYEKCNRNQGFDDRLQKSCDKLEGIQSHFNGIVKYDLEETNQPKRNSHSPKAPRETKWMIENGKERKPFNSTDNHLSDIRIPNEKDKCCQTDLDDLYDDSETSSSYNCRLHYDTQTYFDKHKKNDKEDNLAKLYAEEMNLLKQRLNELRNSAYKNSTSARMVAESLLAKDEETEKEALNKNSPRLVRRTKSKLIRVKTKGGRMVNTVKIRRSNMRTPASSKVSSVESEGIQSDYSDSDESIREAEEDIQVSENLPEGFLSKETIDLADIAGSGDSTLWPVRESLFPHVAPYIFFNTYNAEETRKIPVGRKFFKWKLSTITPVIVRKVISNSGFVMVRSEFTRESNQWLGTWGKHIKSPMFKTLKEYQKLNHFPGTFQLGRKDRLWRNFQRMINAFGHKEFGFLPHTYVLPHELKLLKYNWENKTSGGEWWIIKPPASARGVGIKVINKWAQLPKKTSLVVQKYITNPYLINGSKFDLRLYVLVTSFNPLRIYLYSEGLVRFASVKYSSNAKDIKEKYMHLTNYSINKLSSNYTANEDADLAQGHKWTITKLLEYLNTEGVDVKALWRNLELLVVKTMIACEAPITDLCLENMNTRYNCYELFGIDVLLDSKLKPWLLEVNISPSLHSSSPLDEHVKGPMVQTLFNMAQFHLPSRLATLVKPNLKCYDSKLYTTNLTPKEICKQDKFVHLEKRQDYLESILENLTGDDVRHLTQAEDELRVKDKFKRIFPSASTHKLLDFMEPRYYNRLFDAWENKYENNREDGIRRLQLLCSEKMHLRGIALAGIHKSGQTTNNGVKTTPSKEKVQTKEIVSTKEITTESLINEEPTIISSSK